MHKAAFMISVCLFLAASAPEGASGQDFTPPREGGLSGVEAQGMSFNRFVRPGEAFLQVWVISDNRSGLYEVGETVSLGELIVLTGAGPGITTLRERRRTNIRLYRGEGGTREIIYEASLEEMVQEPERYPRLQEGDVVMMETKVRQRFHWRDALQIVSAASTMILLIERIERRL
ncbi:MAG: hypothetical protein ACOCTG_04925 [Bacteroidota bacterium]